MADFAVASDGLVLIPDHQNRCVEMKVSGAAGRIVTLKLYGPTILNLQKGISHLLAQNPDIRTWPSPAVN